MRWAVLTLLLLSGCSAASGPNDAPGAIAAALRVIAAGIDREDPLLASEPVSPQFVMGTNVGTRYFSDPWGGRRGVGDFRSFFNAGFALLANTDQKFTVTNIDVNGAVATATVDSRFDAVNINTMPPENVTYSTTDIMVFQLEDGGWRLVRWDEQAPPTEPQ